MTEPKSLAVDFDPFAAGEIARGIPLTSPQREIWLAVQLGGEDANCAYNEGLSLTFELTFEGALDRAALAASLAELAQRHESLRTTFAADGSAAFVSASGALPLASVDFGAEPDPLAAYRALEQREVSTPFDLRHGPLARAYLVELGARKRRLLLVLHHIICDGWSFGVLVSELGALYRAFNTQTAAQLEPPESYAEYAEERAQHEQSSEAKRSLAYWADQFRDSVPVLELPLDRPRPPLRTYRAERLDHALSPELVLALRALAKRHGASMLQLLLTGFQVLLARLADQWDVVVGLPAAGQASSGRLGLVGHAVSYLPIRARLDPARPFAEALAQTKARLAEALDHQDVTFGSLLANLSLARDPSRVPLAPVCFNLEQGFEAADFAELAPQVGSVARTFEVFEIFANLVDRKRTIVVEVQYNCDLFVGDTIRDWLASYEALLSGLVAAPERALSELPLLDGEMLARLRSWNDTRASFERDTPIHGFFERSVERAPERAALLFEGEQLSYAELEARANQLAHALERRGVGPEQIVGVCLRRSIDMVVALLGVLKAGGAYLPLDPRYPAERLQYMLADAGAELVIARQDSVAALGAAPSDVLLLNAEREALARAPSARPARRVEGPNLGYVIYTSGSTGKPKGVLVEHRQFANLLAGVDQHLHLSSPGAWLCATSISFDISLVEIFGALGRGFTVVIHSDESGPEYELAALIRRHRVTHFQCTPSQASLLVQQESGRDAIASLRELVLAGEALPVDLARELLALLRAPLPATPDGAAQDREPGRLLNMYGPTETTVYATAHELTIADAPVPIGTPLANVRTYLLDARGEPCARGALGELYLGGEGVARGYRGRPELTQERFLPDRFGDDPTARMYRTGDLARFRADGALEFFGRNDQQVKIRGYRIELGEIEAALRAHGALRDAAVVAREERAGDKRLVAYLVCDDPPTIPELKAFLTQQGLPDYMLPQAYVALPKLPTTGSGKLDRRALPAPEAQPSLSAGRYVAPEGELEQHIADAWRAVLGLSRVGAEENFFDLGGHSLLVVRLSEELALRTGQRMAIPDLFRFPTVASLARYLRTGGAERSGSSERGAARRGSERRTTGRRG